MYFNTNINLIRVPRVFSSSHPNEDKMNACRAYYRENHKIDRDIVVDENMQLKDGYIGYLVYDTEDRLNLNVGSHAIVRTKFGDEEILITRIERVSKAKKKKMGHLKRVVRCLAE